MTKPLSKAEEHASATAERIQRKADFVRAKGADAFADKLDRVAAHCREEALLLHFRATKRKRKEPAP